MRSRYAAYAVGDLDYVFSTWHPRTRPDEVTPEPAVTWTELEIVDVEGDIVEFRAHFRTASGPAVLHERSRFERRRDRWVYVESVS